MFPEVFSLAVSGNGEMAQPLVEKLKERFPRIVIYDRNAEARRAESDPESLAIPQVAYVDVLFHKNGVKEAATVRCFHRHRYFNYDLGETKADPKREETLLNNMLDAVNALRTLPKMNTPRVEERPAPGEPTAEPAAEGAESEAGADPEASR
jgi:hypothetical protein